MKELRRNEFIDMLNMAELLYEETDKYVKCDIPTLGAVTYYPKADKLNIHKVNKWEDNGYEFVKNVLDEKAKEDSRIYFDKFKPKIKQQKSDEELRNEFAGLAMNGLLSNPEYTSRLSGNTALPVPSYLANLSFEVADAMVKRSKIK